MCGIAGFLTPDSIEGPERLLRKMGKSIAHRGPDADGVWFDGAHGLGLVHRRLAIQDLSPAGAQPMVSPSGRYIIVFNGEIYNFKTLGKELLGYGYSFKGHSDTEVMLAAIEHWGIESAIPRFYGMFAFALVDREKKALYLTRDRMGEKPLYYGWQSRSLLFGSELKALRVHPSFSGELEKNVLPLLLRHNFIPAPHTIFKGIFKVRPGHLVEISYGAAGHGEVTSDTAFWDMSAISEREPPPQSRDAAANKLEDILGNVIQEQMISDVPLGAFLSGGIDSSTIVALMKARASRPVKTFTIGFNEPGFNEAEHAAAVAAHLGTEHHELYVTEKDALNVVPDLPATYDEPFADSSQLPTMLVSRMTREHVTVSLSGDGGDELFCGYGRYNSMMAGWQKRHSATSRLRGFVSRLPTRAAANLIRRAVPAQRTRSLTAIEDRLIADRACSRAEDLSAFYRSRISYWPDPSVVLRDSNEPVYGLSAGLPESIPGDSLKTLMWRDLNWYLPDDILVKVDRAAMACSLETRVPLLDERVVRYALSLPVSMNMENGLGKQVLRQVLYRHVPKALIDRPKAGFAVPIGVWLRSSLRDWAETLLDEHRLDQQGLWNTGIIRAYWEEHLTGREDFSFQLWGILMFQSWLDQQMVDS
ncbi:asparagine synthase (glutamine-hydrolyzing) [Marinobacter sp. V034]|uniref:asparagine synthase (glutamine-hydrolyzing) n=1 Tax=Marinobacter sp. V034 TaxID=3459610 RepID=UPI004043A67B